MRVAKRLSGRPRLLAVLALFLVPAVATSIGDMAVPPVAAATTPQLRFRYQILDGRMNYTFDATESCTSAVDFWTCGFGVLTKSQQTTSAIDLAVYAPGPMSWATTPGFTTNLRAPTRVEKFEYSRDGGSRHRYGADCFYTRTSSRDLMSVDQAVPSYMDASLQVTPGVELGSFSPVLMPSTGTEPRFGWRTVPGLHYTSSSRYSRALETNTQSSDGCVASYTNQVEQSIYSPLDIIFDVPRVDGEHLDSVSLLECTSAITCTYRVQGGNAWGYAPEPPEQVSGGGQVAWWFDIAVKVEGVICNDGEVDVQGDVGGVPWFTWVVQANGCAPGVITPGSASGIGDIVMPASYRAALTAIMDFELNEEESSISYNDGAATVRGQFDLCTSPLNFIPGGRIGKGLGRLISWGARSPRSAMFAKLSKKLVREYNHEVDRLLMDKGFTSDLFGDAAARAYLSSVLTAAFETSLNFFLETGEWVEVCVPAWVIDVNLSAEPDGSGLIYSINDAGLPSASVTYTLKARNA